MILSYLIQINNIYIGCNTIEYHKKTASTAPPTMNRVCNTRCMSPTCLLPIVGNIASFWEPQLHSLWWNVNLLQICYGFRGGGSGDVHVELLHRVSIFALDGGKFSTSRSCCFTPRTGPWHRHWNWKVGYCLCSILISINYLRADVCGLNKIMVENLNLYVAWNLSICVEILYQ